MTVYLDIIMLLNFLVDFLLLMGTNRLCGFQTGWKRPALAAGVGALYGGMCLLPGFHFLGNVLWRTVSLFLVTWIAYGFSKSGLRRGIVFTLLSMALGGIAMGVGMTGFWSLIAGAAGVFLMCALGFREKLGSVSYIPVELNYCGKRMRLTALCDTGNALRDPVTGRSVLVIGADAAQQLTGLTQQQLNSPVEVMQSPPLPGLRLVPYRAVGQPGGLMLALRLQEVTIGNWKGSSLVAFAPEGLNGEGAYQALTGEVA